MRFYYFRVVVLCPALLVVLRSFFSCPVFIVEKKGLFRRSAGMPYPGTGGRLKKKSINKNIADFCIIMMLNLDFLKAFCDQRTKIASNYFPVISLEI